MLCPRLGLATGQIEELEINFESGIWMHALRLEQFMNSNRCKKM
jgi:hypothetical protein